jgi:hypothetical protein
MSNDSTRQHLIGTWKLIAAVREEISSGTKTELQGTGAKRAQFEPVKSAVSATCPSRAGFCVQTVSNTEAAGAIKARP